ncbi:MAG: sugar ABC transporter permease, partial [Alphaproteobacteria bacterium]
MSSDNYLHIVTQDSVSNEKIRLGRLLMWGSVGLFVCTVVWQILQVYGVIDTQLSNWRPSLYAYFFWAICLCSAQVLLYGERGKRTLFILPAVLFVVAMVIFPLIFALGIAF